MRKFFAVISVLGLMIGTKVFADSTPVANPTPVVTAVTTPSDTTTTGTKHKGKKKTTPVPTPQPTVVPTAVPTVAAKKASPTPTAAVSAPVASEFSSNIRLYDRVGASGDLRKAVALAAKTLGSSPVKHDQSVFLWLSKVTDGSAREAAYIRFSINGIELGGPRNPWIVLTGVVYDQSGSELKNGDSIEVAVDFRDVKVDYEGTKLGEIQKGNDIADQFYELMATHASYQWVLMAQDRVRDENGMHGVPAFVVNAREGYTFLENLNHSHNMSER